MDTLRKICIAICVPLLSLSLFFLLASIAFNAYFGSPTPLKKTLAASRIYDHVVESILNSAKDKSENQTEEKLPIDIPEVKNAAQQSFSPQFVQQSTEKIIDGVFGWLDGTTSEPQFSIDIASSRTSFIENVANAAVTHVQALPVCTTPPDTNPMDNPFDATCRPPNFDPTAIKQEILSKLNSEDSPLANDTLTFADLQGKDEKPINEKLAVVPKAYQISKRVPYILAVIALLFSGAIFFLHRSHQRALKTLGTTFTTTGVTVLVLSLISWFISRQAKFSGGNIDQTLQQDLLRGFKALTESFSRAIFIGSTAYILIGVGLLLLARKLQPQLSEEQKQNNINTVLKTKELTDADTVKLEARKPEINNDNDASLPNTKV